MIDKVKIPAVAVISLLLGALLAILTSKAIGDHHVPNLVTPHALVSLKRSASIDPLDDVVMVKAFSASARKSYALETPITQGKFKKVKFSPDDLRLEVHMSDEFRENGPLGQEIKAIESSVTLYTEGSHGFWNCNSSGGSSNCIWVTIPHG